MVVQNEEQIIARFKQGYYGKVYRLFKIKDSKFSMALDTIAGFKIFNYVVHDPQIQQDLVNSKLLIGDYNIIPNMKIRGAQINDNLLRKAQELAQQMNSEVWLPLDVIQFQSFLKPTMQFVFGNFLICSDQKIAKKLCFDREYGIKCITLDGDTYNPSGMLDGGYKGQQDSLIGKAFEVSQLQEEAGNLSKKIAEVQNQINQQQKLQDEQ